MMYVMYFYFHNFHPIVKGIEIVTFLFININNCYFFQEMHKSELKKDDTLCDLASVAFDKYSSDFESKFGD